MRHRLQAVVAIVAVAIATGCGAHLAPDAHRIITITLVRHGQSEGNATGVIDTSVPGPDLTELGQAQALMAANLLRSAHCDGVFASTMIRTQETAKPLSEQSGEPVVVLSGLREIEAGRAEGQLESSAAATYYKPIIAWASGHRDVRIPGSIDGDEFDVRFDKAIDEIYRSGASHPVVFSHGAAIAAWTVMNARKASVKLLTSNPLPNTGTVVIAGSPEAGWTLKKWNDVEVP